MYETRTTVTDDTHTRPQLHYKPIQTSIEERSFTNVSVEKD